MGQIAKNRSIGELKEILTGMCRTAKESSGIDILTGDIRALSEEILEGKVREFMSGYMRDFSIMELQRLRMDLNKPAEEVKEQVDLEEEIKLSREPKKTKKPKKNG